MIKIVPIEEELENNISRPYTKKQWQKFEEEAKSYIDSIFKLENSSMVEQLPDMKKAESSSLSFPTT